MVAASVVAMENRRIPADMLLLRARTRSEQPALADPANLEILSSDEDELVESTLQVPPAGTTTWYRPVDDVHLGAIGWRAPIDHDALQGVLACTDASAGRGAALEVSITPSDLAVCAQLASGPAGAQGLVLERALRLPDRLSGASASTRHALGVLLAAYRHASLSYAWAQRLEMATDQFARERDEAAVSLLSTLRAVLGER
jgi:hypothetical protein